MEEVKEQLIKLNLQMLEVKEELVKQTEILQKIHESRVKKLEDIDIKGHLSQIKEIFKGTPFESGISKMMKEDK
jgi:hypothetical protein